LCDRGERLFAGEHLEHVATLTFFAHLHNRQHRDSINIKISFDLDYIAGLGSG
jgi:hypothetical protein